MAKKQTAEVQVVTAAQELEMKNRFLALKQSIDEKAKELNAIKIIDASSYSSKVQCLAELSSVVNKVDKERLAISKPWRDFVDKINETGKAVIGIGEEAVKGAKKAIMTWDAAELERKAKEEAEAKRKQQEIEAEQRRKEQEVQDYISYLNDWVEKAIELIGSAKALQELSHIRVTYLENFPELKYPDLEAFHAELKQTILNAGIEATNAIKAGKVVDYESLQQMTAEVNSMAAHQALTVEEAIETETEQAVAATIVSGSAPSNMAKYRTTWSYEVADITKVPADWLLVDHAKVQKFIDGLKAMESAELRHENVINGIRIIQKKSVIAG